MLDLPYRAIVGVGHAWFKAMDFRFRIEGAHHVPRTGGAVLCINHVSYVDFILAGYGARASKRFTRFMAKREVFDHPVAGPLMRSMHHISVDRAEGQQSYDDAVRYLRDGEIVGVFPEATISRSFLIKELKTGAVRMAAEADVPLIPVILWGTQRLMTKDHPRDFGRHKTISITMGEPMDPHGKAVQKTAELRERMSTMLDEAIRSYPEHEQPPGSWWLPASYGGSAPTPEEAKQLDQEEQRRRAEKRRQQRAKR
ncbi:lysophospholipid acyltransferase family protein [Nocardioides caldifontis]|uniref:lysophospholipid acyltransferase family protein n=1 Tax=Nocardioides caldifontis TaxID=2588938 RepID=UPI001EF14FFC|nr:lysophospholipid acyltransferase family protein [Nocardioides caldifontis]